eukprot:5590167-Karenia_brevis.AAC.1
MKSESYDETGNRRVCTAVSYQERQRRHLVSLSAQHGCQHISVKVFPVGPRDNGEISWQCFKCGVEM